MKKRLVLAFVLGALISICHTTSTSAWTNCAGVPSNDQYACDMGNIEGLYNDSAALNGTGSNCSEQNGSARSACESGVGSNVYSYLKCSYLATTKAKKVCSYIASNAAGEITSTGSVSTSWADAKKKAEDKYAGNNSGTTSDGSDSGSDGDGGSSGGDGTVADVNSGSCASILTAFCSEDGTVDLGGLLGMFIAILTGAIVLAGTVGIIICGFLWMTARDNEAQVAKAKKRLLEIVVGIIAWVLLALLANLFIPKKSTDIEDNIDGDTGIATIKPVEKPKTSSQPSNNNNNGNNNSTNTATTPIKPLNEESSSIPCAEGTTDLGTTNEAYSNGSKITIRLCSVPTITSTSAEDSDKHAHVNSRVSGAYYALGKKYQETHNGSSLNVSQSFRTMAKQQYFYNCYINKNCNNGNLAAKPGYSNHQLGTALDFSMYGSGWGNTGVSGFFNQYLSTYGLIRDVTDEDWHVNAIK